jgi:hypothetical protein
VTPEREQPVQVNIPTPENVFVYVRTSDCGDYRIGLGVYALGRLADETESAALRAHVAACGPCREELDELRAVAGLLEWARPSLWTRRGAGHRARTRSALNGACASASRPSGR